MRALVYRNNTLTLEKSYPRPSLESGEALIKVLQAGICNTEPGNHPWLPELPWCSGS